jgi:hypothetical protein
MPSKTAFPEPYFLPRTRAEDRIAPEKKRQRRDISVKQRLQGDGLADLEILR